MRSALKLSLAVAVVMFASSCTHTVMLTVKNQLPASPPPPSLNVGATTKDSGGADSGTTSLGTAGPNQSVNGSFKVKKGGSYAVKADLSSGVNVYRSGDKTINKDVTDEVDIAALNAGIIDPSDISSIEATFGQLGPQIGFNPVTLKSALGSVFGGLIWYVDTTPSTAETQPVSIVPPSLLTGAVDYATFPWPSGHDSKDITISTDASLKAAASVPLWGSISANFAANSVYKMHWSITEFGNVEKTDTASVPDKLNALTQAQKDSICGRLQTNNSYVMYVNEMYVVKSVMLTYQKGNSVSAGASLSGGSVVTASGAYDFSASQTQEAEQDEVVVNVFGPTWNKSSLPFCSGGHAAPTLPLVISLSRLGGTLKGLDLSTATVKVQQ